MGDRYCTECGCAHSRAYDPPIRCDSCCMAIRCAEEHAKDTAVLHAEIARQKEAIEKASATIEALQFLVTAGRPSLHAEAMTAAHVHGQPTISDRDLAVALLRHVTGSPDGPRTFRWCRVPLHHGSGVKGALLRVAGIDPDEVTGWVQEAGAECPRCGWVVREECEHDDEARAARDAEGDAAEARGDTQTAQKYRVMAGRVRGGA